MIESPSAYLLEIEVENQGNVFPMVPQGRGVADIVLRIEDV